jgi:hypothetical protein
MKYIIRYSLNLFFFGLTSSLFALDIEELKKKYEFLSQPKEKKKSFGYTESLAEKKEKQFTPFVIQHGGGVQNKQFDLNNKKSAIPFSNSSFSYKNDTPSDNQYYKKEMRDEDAYDEDELIEEILRNLEGL